MLPDERQTKHPEISPNHDPNLNPNPNVILGLTWESHLMYSLNFDSLVFGR